MRSLRALVMIALALGLVASAAAQGPVSVQTSPQELRASQACADIRGTSPQTATIPAVAGNYFYVNFIETTAYSVGGAAAAGNVGHFSATNLPNSPTFGIIATAAGTASNTQIMSNLYAYSGTGMKSSAPGTAVTVVAPTITNVGVHIQLCGYYGP